MTSLSEQSEISEELSTNKNKLNSAFDKGFYSKMGRTKKVGVMALLESQRFDNKIHRN